MNFILKRALAFIVGSQSLQVQVFLWLADLLVAQTDNEFDDELVEILRDALGGDKVRDPNEINEALTDSKLIAVTK